MKPVNFTVTVTDKETSDPLQLVSVILKRNNTIIAATSTNPFGRAIFNEIQSGNYEISTRIHWVSLILKIRLQSISCIKVWTIQISEKNIQLKEIEIKGNRINANNSSNATIDITSGSTDF